MILKLTKETALEYKKYCESYEGDVNSISDYETLEEGVAEVLGSIDGRIELSISSLTAQDAAFLAKNTKGISFDGIIEIDTATAKALVATTGDLFFSGVIANGEAQDVIREKVEWCNFIRRIDSSYLTEIESIIQESGDCSEMAGECILTDAGLVESLYNICEKNDLDPGEVFLDRTCYFSAEALRAIAENHDPGHSLDISWGRRYDEKGRIWGRDHIEALAVFRGEEIKLNSDSDTLTPENLSLLSKFSLLVNSTGDFGDEYSKTFENWKGYAFTIDNNASITPSVARAIANSGMSTFINDHSIASNEVLKELCQGSNIEHLILNIPFLGKEQATLILAWEGIGINTNSRHVTKSAASILQDVKCSIFPFHTDTSMSIYADEETIKLLENVPEIERIENCWVGEDELKWQDRCRLVLDKETVIDEDFGDHSIYPRIATDVIEEFVSDSESELSLEGLLIFDEGQVELLSAIEDQRSITLSVCRLLDREAEVLASIRKAHLFFNNLTEVTPKGFAALKKRKAWTRFEYDGLQVDSTVEDDSRVEENSDADGIEAVSFNLGRLRARLWQEQSVLGGPEELLESIEQAIRENGLSRNFAMQEAWIGRFLLNCVDGEDTSTARKAIEDLYWDN